jgi:hypothetical protein
MPEEQKVLFPSADERIEFSRRFESISKTPSFTKHFSASQRISADLRAPIASQPSDNAELENEKRAIPQ